MALHPMPSTLFMDWGEEGQMKGSTENCKLPELFMSDLPPLDNEAPARI